MNSADFVAQKSASTGTGNFSLYGITGYETFSGAFPNSDADNTFFYFIRSLAKNERESGRGYLDASGNLVRVEVFASTNNNAFVNFTEGTKDVTNDIPAYYQNNYFTVDEKDFFDDFMADPDSVILPAINSSAIFRGQLDASKWTDDLIPGAVVTGTVDGPQRITNGLLLQSALNYAYANRLTFLLPPGTYEIDKADGLVLTPGYNGFTWIGSRRGSVIRSFTANAPILSVGGLSGSQDSSDINISGVSLVYGVEQTGNVNAIPFRVGKTWKSVFEKIETSAQDNGASPPTLRPYHSMQITRGTSSSPYYFSNTMRDCAFGGGQVSIMDIKNFGTGNVFSNIYCKVGGAPNAHVCTGPMINLNTGVNAAQYESSFTQLNVEWGITPAGIYMDNVRGITFESTHFEGVQPSGSSGALIRGILAFASFINPTFLNCKFLAANSLGAGAAAFSCYRQATVSVLGMVMLWDNQASPQADTAWTLFYQDSDNINNLFMTTEAFNLTLSDNQTAQNCLANMSLSNLVNQAGFSNYRPEKIGRFEQGPVPQISNSTIDFTDADQTVYPIYERSAFRMPVAPAAVRSVTLSKQFAPAGSLVTNVPARRGDIVTVVRARGTANGNAINIYDWDGQTLLGSLTSAGTKLSFIFNGKNWQISTLAMPDSLPATINTQTDNYTLVLADAGKIVEMNKATALNLTVPPNSSVAFPIGTQIGLTQLGAGQLTIVPGSGVTIRTAETLLFEKQYSGGSLYKRGLDEWVLFGKLEAA